MKNSSTTTRKPTEIQSAAIYRCTDGCVAKMRMLW